MAGLGVTTEARSRSPNQNIQAKGDSRLAVELVAGSIPGVPFDRR
jgi:hypothetical protein